MPVCFRLLLLLALLAVLPGCTPKPPASTTTALPFAGVKLKLLIVDDPSLASAAERFRGEWRAQTGAEFEVEQCSAAELLSGASTADAVIYPSHLLGQLAAAGRIVAVPKDVLNDSQLQWQDVFELLRTHEAAWEGEAYAIPFGSPLLVCYCRADLLKELNQPPRTWGDYEKLAARSGCIEPLGPGWRGLTLLARAAAYAKHRDYFSVLFNLESMTPLIDSPPFVKALEELTRAAKNGPAEQLNYTPDDVRAAFWRGDAGLALTWPTAARASDAEAESEADWDVRIGPLPGSAEVYNPEARQWQPSRSMATMPLLGMAGRLASVTKQSSQSPAAFQLLTGLAGAEWSARVSTASPSTTLFRQAHVKSPRTWVERSLKANAAKEYGEVVHQALSGQDSAHALNLPGREEYLAALDRAVERSVRGDATAGEALAECAASWREITERLGLDAQRQAYRRLAVKQ